MYKKTYTSYWGLLQRIHSVNFDVCYIHYGGFLILHYNYRVHFSSIPIITPL